MLTIIHGENLIKSREKLFQLKQRAQNAHQQLTTILAKNLNWQNLENALYANDLFGQEHCLIIEELHSLAHSKQRSNFIRLIQAASQNLELILWEKKTLSSSHLKNFQQAQVFAYPMGKALWNFLDNLNPLVKTKKQQLLSLKQAIEQDSAEFCFIMLSKRVSELIALKMGADISLHPFVKNKLIKQHQAFSLKKLLAFHQELYQLDKKIKHSQNLLSLASELDLLLINL